MQKKLRITLKKLFVSLYYFSFTKFSISLFTKTFSEKICVHPLCPMDLRFIFIKFRLVIYVMPSKVVFYKTMRFLVKQYETGTIKTKTHLVNKVYYLA